MKHFYKLLFCICIFHLPLLNSQAQVVVETVILEEDFEGNNIDPALTVLPNFGTNLLENSNSYGNYLKHIFNGSTFFYIFSISKDLVQNYDSVHYSYDIYYNKNNTAGQGQGNIVLHEQNIFPAIGYYLEKESQINILYKTLKGINNNTQTILEVKGHTIFPSNILNEALLISGTNLSTQVTKSTQNGQILCSDPFIDMLIHCACSGYQTNTAEYSMCQNIMQNAEDPFELSFGIDNLKITGYKTEITTNTTSQTEAKPTLIMITNLLGQEVTNANDGEVYLYHYSNGSVQKRIMR